MLVTKQRRDSNGCLVKPSDFGQNAHFFTVSSTACTVRIHNLKQQKTNLGVHFIRIYYDTTRIFIFYNRPNHGTLQASPSNKNHRMTTDSTRHNT